MLPGGGPPTPAAPPERTTEGGGSRSSGTSATGTGVAAARSLTNARIGNQGCGTIGAGYVAGCPGGYQAMSDQRPVVAPQPHSASETPSMLSTRTAGAGPGAKVCALPTLLDRYPPLKQKNTCGVAHCAQYERSPHSRDRTSEKTTSGRVLHRRGVAAKTAACGQKGRIIPAKCGDWQHKEVTRKPNARATVNHRLGLELRISQVPRDG
jgi:hypothetical protein